MKVSKRLAIYLFCLFGVLSLAVSYPAQASDYGIELVGVADQYTLPPDSDGTVTIRLTGPGMGAINSAVLKLNGKRVEFGDRVRENAYSMTGIVSGLQPGDNLIQLYANVKASVPVAQLRTSILLLPEMVCASMAGQTIRRFRNRSPDWRRRNKTR